MGTVQQVPTWFVLDAFELCSVQSRISLRLSTLRRQMTCLDNNHQSACTLSQPSVFKFSLLRYPIFSIAVFQTCIPFFKPFNGFHNDKLPIQSSLWHQILSYLYACIFAFIYWADGVIQVNSLCCWLLTTLVHLVLLSALGPRSKFWPLNIVPWLSRLVLCASFNHQTQK